MNCTYTVGMDHATITSQRAEEPCTGIPSDDLYSVSLIMNDRLRRFFAGEYQTVAGFSLTSPSEYLAMMGLTEAVLYTLRIHYSVLKNAMTLRFNASSDVTPKELQSLTGLVASSRTTIDAVLKVVGRGYDSDLLMLHLQDWAIKLEQSAAVVSDYILPLMLSPSSYCNPAEYPLRSPLTRLVADYIPTEVRDRNQQPYKHIIDATLRNGVKMPVMGLGTWLLQGQECVDAVVNAVRHGYRSIDTAEAYRNEVQVGKALQIVMNEGTVTRSELFIASKLSDESNGGFEKVQALVAKQLQELQLTYLDLYMLHSPMSNEDLQQESWRALELLYQKKIIRALGVSNFGRDELERLCSTASVQPMVVQNKVDVYHVGKQLDIKGDTVVSFAASQKILVVAYSTHSAYPFVMKPLDDPIVRHIAHHHSHDGSSLKVTPSQVLLRWAIQKGFAVIPRSSDPEHLLENYRALSMVPLSADEMNLLDALQYLVASPVSVPVLV